jgi:hypothetical protein
VKHSNYRTTDIYRLMIAETWGTTPNPFKLFALDISDPNLDLKPGATPTPGPLRIARA